MLGVPTISIHPKPFFMGTPFYYSSIEIFESNPARITNPNLQISWIYGYKIYFIPSSGRYGIFSSCGSEDDTGDTLGDFCDWLVALLWRCCFGAF